MSAAATLHAAARLATEPERQWRNKWRMLRACVFANSPTGLLEGRAKAGDILWSHDGSPSRQAAEAAATEFMLENIRVHGLCLYEYLGAECAS